MDRLTFVYSHTIQPFSSARHGINLRFSTAFAQATIDWTLNIRRFGFPTRLPRNVRLELSTVINRASIPPTLCSCLFRLQKEGGDVECNVTGETDGGQHVKFAIPADHELIRTIVSTEAERNGQAVVLTMVIQLPKKSFIANRWDCPVEPTPVVLDYRFEPLQNCAEHDLVVVCADGEFSANRGALFRSSNYCKKLLKGLWQDKTKVQEVFTMATARIVFTYLLSHTFLAPALMTPQLLEEVKKTAEKFTVPQKNLLLDNMEILVCRQLSETESALEDVLRWLVVASQNGLARIEDAASVMIVKRFHQQLMQEYSADVEVKDEKKKELRIQLHARNSRGGATTPFKKLLALQQTSERVMVVEKAA